jgi:RND family efflux transporter MFP subunit
MKRIISIVAILAVVALVAFRLVSNKKAIDEKNQLPDNTGVAVAVNVAPVQSRVSQRNLSLVGTVAANQVIDVKAEAQGRLLSLNVDLGDQVRKGQVIGRIENQLQQLAVSNAEQQLADARQNVERYKNLYEGGAATQAQYDQYRLAFENATNQLAQARKQLANAVVIAPVSGQVTQKAVEAGAFLNLGAAIVTIVDVSRLKVQLNVAENDVYALKPGDPVNITTTVFPGVTYPGKITFISPAGDEAHNYPVEVSFANQAKNPLKAGTYVDVAFNRQSQTPSLQIPREALVGSVKNAQVYVVGDDNITRLRKVTIGADNGDYLEVLEGIKEGERVVTTGQINLTDSTRVSIISSNARDGATPQGAGNAPASGGTSSMSQ